ncbi:hypothetical protein [Georgenia sp. H159]|uniref:hypothetical protein n=1 Tax=Georgenia sp. H159 TaxID=3076115 RepID=UPI002D76B257|nr:hypothetical protein [Georgenia sp. H159]
MERLTGEARDRVRATSLWLVAAVTVAGVIIAIFGIVIGFAEVRVVPSAVVDVSPDGLELTVEYPHSSCQFPAGVDVEEGADVVVITARVSERTPMRGRSCRAEAVAVQETVVLETPLGERELRTSGTTG